MNENERRESLLLIFHSNYMKVQFSILKCNQTFSSSARWYAVNSFMFAFSSNPLHVDLDSTLLSAAKLTGRRWAGSRL